MWPRTSPAIGHTRPRRRSPIAPVDGVARFLFGGSNTRKTNRTLISRERPDPPAARSLIAELETEVSPFYPPTSRHGVSVQKLIDQGVAFLSCDTTTPLPDAGASNCSGQSAVS